VSTPAQRITNAVWLREQLRQVISECDDCITTNNDLVRTSPHEGERLVAITKVYSTERWKRHLERVLRGETL
jgi:hypothetical protein